MIRMAAPAICLSLLIAIALPAPVPAQTGETTPLGFLKKQEVLHRDEGGEVYLGKVMTVNYEAYALEMDPRYHGLVLELTDVIKTPLRKNYRLVLRGYSDNSGPPEKNLALSRERAEHLKTTLTRKYFMDGKRITTEGYGEKDPVASNESARGRSLNRRVEIHVYGDVSEAVRFSE